MASPIWVLCDASLELWAQDNGFASASMRNFAACSSCATGDAFAGGSRPADAEEFDEIGVAEDDLTAYDIPVR